jgi:hypothetical protein
MPTWKKTNESLSRRVLLRTTSAALIGSAAMPGLSAQESSPAAERSGTYVRARMPTAWLAKPTQRGGDETGIGGGPTGAQHRLTSFINKEEGLRDSVLDGKRGWQIKIKEPGYRGIPLWAVRAIDLKIDGSAIDQGEIIFILDSHRYRVEDLQKQIGAQWWLFDWGTLFVPKADGLAPGEHDVEVKMTYTSMYGSGGSTTSISAKERMVLRNSGI